MSIVGAYGAELQLKPADPCLMGLDVLACLDTKIVFRKGDKALAYRVVAQDSAPSTELIFEPSSPQPLRFLYQFDQNRKQVLVTLESWRGDRLQAIVKILRAPNELSCPVLLPSDFTDQRKVLEAYRCLVDAGLRVETKLQFNDYSITLPALLLDDGDYAAAERAIRQIANRVDPLFKEAIKSFTAFIDDQVVQALAQCVLGKSWPQAKAERMVSLLDSSRMWECLNCGGGIIAGAAFWAGLIFLTPTTGGGAALAIVNLWVTWPLGLAQTTISCINCGKGGGSGNSGDKGGGGECITVGSGPNKTLMWCPPN